MRAVEEHVATLRSEADRLAASAAAAGASAPVPTCPGWTVRNLLAHTGGVHAWATSIISGRLAERPDAGDLDDNVREVEDADLVDWYRAQAHGLADAIAGAPDDLECLTFLPAPSARAFGARRQAHECAIHRADADAAAGRPTSYAAEQATDGVAEMVHGFAARKRTRDVFDPPRTLQLRSTDGRVWHLTLTTETVVAADEQRDADATVTGTASDLFLLLWNRLDLAAPSLRIEGDPVVPALWRDNVAVRWG